MALWQQAQAEKWEGIIGKNLDSRYAFGGRGEAWIKVKTLQREVFWVMGFTAGTGWRQGTFGSLILARIENGVIKPVGEVGTGFDQRELERLNDQLKSSTIPTPWIANYPGPSPTWVTPFQVMVEFLELTNDGKIRFPSYKGQV
jgi:bifunctional non-homologous end joining protein LigD